MTLLSVASFFLGSARNVAGSPLPVLVVRHLFIRKFRSRYDIQIRNFQKEFKAGPVVMILTSSTDRLIRWHLPVGSLSCLARCDGQKN
jgi:hypothetical protein